MSGRLYVISGASGVGKSTVLRLVMAQRPDLTFSVSATTRAPRSGEREGISYYFLPEETFRSWIEAGEFLEYDAHNGYYYGTPRGQLEEKLAKGDVLLDIEPNGAFAVRRARPDATLIFIMPPSREELERRLRGRGDTPEAEVALRMQRADWEMAQRVYYDYVVENRQPEDCAGEILKILSK